MTRTFKIVEDIVNSMDLSIKVNDINNETLSVCKTLHIRVGSVVKDHLDNFYQVYEFENDELIKVSPLGEYDFTGDVVFAPKPVFIQGKWMSANSEYLLMESDTRAKTPLIWLVRGYEEKHNGKEFSVKMEVEPLIFFLDEANFDSWLNEDHDKEAVNPMYNLANLFVETVEKNSMIKTLDGWKIHDEPRFGVKISSEKGNNKRILSDDLSGVGLRIPLKMFSENCKC